MTEYVCMYCQYGRDAECDDRACTCCFGVPGEPANGLTVICSRDYTAAKNFADRRRWPPHSWVYAHERRLRGSEVHRAVYLHGFWDRPDAYEIRALVDHQLSKSVGQAGATGHATAARVAAGCDPDAVSEACRCRTPGLEARGDEPASAALATWRAGHVPGLRAVRDRGHR